MTWPGHRVCYLEGEWWLRCWYYSDALRETNGVWQFMVPSISWQVCIKISAACNHYHAIHYTPPLLYLCLHLPTCCIVALWTTPHGQDQMLRMRWQANCHSTQPPTARGNISLWYVRVASTNLLYRYSRSISLLDYALVKPTWIVWLKYCPYIFSKT